MENPVFLRFERSDYINSKKEILALIMETIYLKKRVNKLNSIKIKKKELKKILKEKIEKICSITNRISSMFPEEKEKLIEKEKIKKRELQKKEIEKDKEDFNVGDDLEKELLMIRKKIEELSFK